MNIDYLVSTLLCTVVGGSSIANPCEITGNIVETSTDNKLLQTAAKVLQSVNMAFLSAWATFHIMDFFNMDFLVMSAYGLTGVLALAISIPILGFAAEKIFPENKEKIEEFQKHYSTTLKVINIFAAALSLATGIYFGYELATIALNCVSIISSGFALHKNMQPRTAIA